MDDLKLRCLIDVCGSQTATISRKGPLNPVVYSTWVGRRHRVTVMKTPSFAYVSSSHIDHHHGPIFAFLSYAHIQADCLNGTIGMSLCC